MDCLELAADARELDMRASPYDLRDYGFEPIAVETPAGRAEYVRAQQSVAERAAPLRRHRWPTGSDLLLSSGSSRVEDIALRGEYDRSFTRWVSWIDSSREET